MRHDRFSHHDRRACSPDWRGHLDREEVRHAVRPPRRGASRPWSPRPPRRRCSSQGDLRSALLKLIADKPSHGYELIKDIEDRFGGAYSPSPGVVYPTLTHLEELGYIRAGRGGQRPQRPSRITDEGREASWPERTRPSSRRSSAGSTRRPSALRRSRRTRSSEPWRTCASRYGSASNAASSLTPRSPTSPRPSTPPPRPSTANRD